MLNFKCSHAARPCGSNRLPIAFILNISCCKNARHRCFSGTFFCQNIICFVQFQLTIQKFGIWLMTYCKKQAGHWQIFYLCRKPRRPHEKTKTLSWDFRELVAALSSMLSIHHVYELHKL
ncbi:hypothetical protein BpHYR1_016134 [Brachionus plicatilis]|uniref:Uncharacterized protein n=1 Tax=Brachionus plicatilis TaxID=10195 RepID=A0A3M7QQ29_BRAPC|nr:hypothetical protein BpHYR1_016134 [Brachionus plicatilis]